jgi:transposase InsO family protein
MTIIARKPRLDGAAHPCIPHTSEWLNEIIVVDRGSMRSGRYVSAVANQYTLAYGEWFWGHYFDTLSEALAHFEGRH